MLKYVESAVTFAEFPDEISLILTLSTCPNHCLGCSEPYLAKDIGSELTFEAIDALIAENAGITLVGFLGGDNDHAAILAFTDYIHKRYNLKVGMYSGQDSLDLSLAAVLDYYKVGAWILPQGDPSTWPRRKCGPISFPFSNQIMYKRVDNLLINVTSRFQQVPIGDYTRYVIEQDALLNI